MNEYLEDNQAVIKAMKVKHNKDLEGSLEESVRQAGRVHFSKLE